MNGPKKVVFEPDKSQEIVAMQVKDGLLEAGVMPNNGFTFDHIKGTKIGGSKFDKDGHSVKRYKFHYYLKEIGKVMMNLDVFEFMDCQIGGGSIRWWKRVWSWWNIGYERWYTK